LIALFSKNLLHKKMIKNLPKNRGIYPLLQAYAKPGIWWKLPMTDLEIYTFEL
jgi:hypothetical protein